MSKNNKAWLAIAGVLILIAAILAFLARARTDTTVTIGALFPLTGGLSSYGEPAQKAAQLAVDEINASGGIRGRMLAIDFQDHQCDPKTAVSAFESLHDAKGVRLFTAVACSGTISSLAPKLTDSVVLGSTITAASLSGISPWVFRDYASDENGAKLFADYIAQKGYKRVGAIYEQTDYAKGLVLSLQKFLAGTGVDVEAEGFATNATDVSTQVSKLKAAQPDIVFVSPQTVSSGAVVLGEFERQGYQPKLMVNENVLKSSDLLSRYSSLLEGAVSDSYVVADSSSLQSLMQKYKQKYGTDCPIENLCSTVYDNVYLLADAARAQQLGARSPGSTEVSAESVKEYLEKVDYQGTSGEIRFGQNHDRENADFTLFLIQGGKGAPLVSK